jgi:hypothetical protein
MLNFILTFRNLNQINPIPQIPMDPVTSSHPPSSLVYFSPLTFVRRWEGGWEEVDHF